MKKLALIVAVLLAGCTDAYIDSKQLSMASEHCADRVGISLLQVAGTMRHHYADHIEYSVAGRCNDGTEFTLKERITKK